MSVRHVLLVVGLWAVGAGALRASRRGRTGGRPLRAEGGPSRPGPQAWALPTRAEVLEADFGRARAYASRALEALVDGGAEQEAAEALVPAFFETIDGARGWFVVSLTGRGFERVATSRAVALAALAADTAFAKQLAQLTVMNVAMPAVTEVAHRRNGNAKAADGARETRGRALALVAQMVAITAGRKYGTDAAEDPVADAQREALAALHAATNNTPGNSDALTFWRNWLDKWGYDDEMRAAIRDTVYATQPEW